MSQLFSHFWQLVCATLSTIVQHGSHVCSTCVCPLVGGEVVRAGEDLAAHSAAVGLVAGVEPHVPRQHVGPRERPLAHLTRGQLASLQTSDIQLSLPRRDMLLSLSCCCPWTETKISTEVDTGPGHHLAVARPHLVPAGHVLGEAVVEAEALAAERTQPLVVVAGAAGLQAHTLPRPALSIMEDTRGYILFRNTAQISNPPTTHLGARLR